MTEYPVLCFDNNGEPYGGPEVKNPIIFNCSCEGCKKAVKWVESNTFPFPSGTIGKMYEKDEVEKIQQTFDLILKKWFDTDMQSREMQYKTRQIFRLTPQPVEKEPETVEEKAAEQYLNDIIGDRSIYKRSEIYSRKMAFIHGANWQKQQSK